VTPRRLQEHAGTASQGKRHRNTKTQAERVTFDRKHKGNALSNKDWQSPVDTDAPIARLKDRRTRLAYKPEHVVDLVPGLAFPPKPTRRMKEIQL